MYIVNIPLDGGTATTAGRELTEVGREIGCRSELVGGMPEVESDVALPCRTEDADLWFAERPDQLGRAQQLCRVQARCLDAALRRREPWGVWGGEIFERGRVIPFKRGRGRPAKKPAYRESTVA